jgi:hypothetical protein
MAFIPQLYHNPDAVASYIIDGNSLARVERLLTEICKYGSEGGVVHTNAPLRPLSISAF